LTEPFLRAKLQFATYTFSALFIEPASAGFLLAIHWYFGDGFLLLFQVPFSNFASFEDLLLVTLRKMYGNRVGRKFQKNCLLG